MFKPMIHFIHSLKTLFFILIVLSFFQLADINPISLGYFFGAKLGSAVGMNMSVPENPINKLALELKTRAAELDEREQNILAREVESYRRRERILLYGIAGGILALFALIILNFYLDARRRPKK